MKEINKIIQTIKINPLTVFSVKKTYTQLANVILKDIKNN